MVMLVWSWRAVGESSYTKRSCQELGQPARTNFSQNSTPYIFLKLLHNPHGNAFSPTQCLFSIVYSLHPSIFYASGIIPMYFCFCGSRFVDFIYDQMYLSTTSARFITGQCNILHSELSADYKIKILLI